MRKPTIWFPNRSDINLAVQVQKMARGWKFWIQKGEILYYLCSENKGADLSFVFAYDCWFSGVVAQMLCKLLANKIQKFAVHMLINCFIHGPY